MVVDVQGKLRLALGSVKDHASIGKAMIYNHLHNDGFSDIEIAVVRATGHDSSPIDDKHMHEILFLVSNSPPGSIPFLAHRISRRLHKTRDRSVALKTLLLIHRLLRGGNRCFEQRLRAAHVSGHLQMSTRCFPTTHFLHKYAAYLEERMDWFINQSGKLEPIMSVSGSEFRCYEEKLIDMVFRKLPKCQEFIDRVLDCSPIFDILPSDGLAQAAMSNALKESFQVYMTFCEGVEALANMFFDLTRPAKGLACEILKRASRQGQELHDLYESCKKVIENKNLEYPSVQIITMDHVMALEQCLSCSTPPPPPTPSLDFLTKSANWLPAARKGKGGGQKDEQRTLFSWTLETKISMVWVVFEDEDHNKEAQHKAEPCNYLNPFATCVDSMIS